MTQEARAELIQASQSTVSKWETALKTGEGISLQKSKRAAIVRFLERDAGGQFGGNVGVFLVIAEHAAAAASQAGGPVTDIEAERVRAIIEMFEALLPE